MPAELKIPVVIGAASVRLPEINPGPWDWVAVLAEYVPGQGDDLAGNAVINKVTTFGGVGFVVGAFGFLIDKGFGAW